MSKRTPAKYLSRKEFAEALGVKPDTLSRYTNMPEPDAEIGDVRGWLPRTVETYRLEREARGRTRVSRA